MHFTMFFTCTFFDVCYLSETIFDGESHWSNSRRAWRFHYSFCFSHESGVTSLHSILVLCLKRVCCISHLLLTSKGSVLTYQLWLFACAACAVENNRWCRYWVVQGSKRKHVRYGCWRFSAIEQVDFAHLGAICLEIFSPMPGSTSCRFILATFWLWKGGLSSKFASFIIFFCKIFLFNTVLIISCRHFVGRTL